MKILLVSPPCTGSSRYYFPLGVAMISSILKNEGHEVYCRNLDLTEEWESLFTEDFTRICPQVLASGGMTPSFGFFKRLFTLSRQMNPGIINVVGGGLISSEPLTLPAIQADIGVIGEGENTVRELFQRLEPHADNNDLIELTDIPGLVLNSLNNSPILTPSRAYIAELDSLPRADYHGFDFAECMRRNPSQCITTSRGCPFHCTFCYCVMGRGKYRYNSIDYVIKELTYLKEEFGLTNIGLIDEIFALKRERIVLFCEQVKDLNLSWHTQVRVEIVDKELLCLMKDAGCNVIFYGLESMCPSVLKSMKKRLKPEQIAHALDISYQNGLKIFGNFIFGDPSETEDTAWETLSWWLEHRKYFINLGKIDCWPGTPIYKQAIERGIISDPIEYIENGCQLINLTSMPYQNWIDTMRRVWACHSSMLFPAKLLWASLEEGNGTVDCICPHCHEKVRLTDVSAMCVHPDRGAHRPPCPLCNFEFDIPLRIPPPTLSKEVQDRFETALHLACQENITAALDTLHLFWDIGWQHPLATYLAASLNLQRGDAATANEIARRGLWHAPTAPYLLEICASSYHRYGDERMSTAFYRQALLIRKSREMAVTPETIEILDPLEAAFHRIFPNDAVNIDAAVSW